MKEHDIYYTGHELFGQPDIITINNFKITVRMKKVYYPKMKQKNSFNNIGLNRGSCGINCTIDQPINH